jgi:WD40 repeat protein
VVNIYRVRKSNNIRRFALAQTLCGHLGPISCVAVSRAYSIVVSGSSDKTCIVWDLNRLNYVRQLSQHDGPILEVAISDTSVRNIGIFCSNCL